MTGSSPPEPELPSFDIVLAELDRAQLAQAARSTGLDTKGGLLLAAAVVLVSTAADPPTARTVASVAAAAAAAACCVGVFWPRMGGEIGPEKLRMEYIHRPAAETALTLMDSRLGVHKADEQRLITRRRYFLAAVGFIALSVLISVLGTLPDVQWRSEPTSRPTIQQPVSPSPASSTSSKPSAG